MIVCYEVIFFTNFTFCEKDFGRVLMIKQCSFKYFHNVDIFAVMCRHRWLVLCAMRVVVAVALMIYWFVMAAV